MADRTNQAYSQPGVPLRFEHVPAFGFSAAQVSGAGLIIIGMNLDRQPFAGEQIFDQQGLVAILRADKPDLANALAGSRFIERGNILPAPRLLDDMRSQSMGCHMKAFSCAAMARAMVPNGPAWFPSAGATI